MFCPNCGKEINNQSNFCTHCGYKFEKQTPKENDIYKRSYYKDSYKKETKQSHKKKEYSFRESFFKGVITMLVICLAIFVGLIFKNNYAGNMVTLDKMKYQQYVENPSLIPELTQPETLSGLLNNLKNVQNFLALYLKVSDDDIETKLQTFDKYRAELLKIQNFDNTNLLQENVTFQIPRNKKEFETIKKQYAKTLSQVGLTIDADESYSKYRLIEDNQFTYKKFGKYLPSDINNYLKLRAKHCKACRFHDKLEIKPYELASRIGEYENFIQSNKEFRYNDEVKDMLFSYTLVYAFTSDRTNKIFIDNKSFVKSDKKFLKKFSDSQLKDMFTHLSTSTEGITEKQFDDMYPYEYQKTLDALKPENTELSDVFTFVRKNIVQLKNDANYEYMYTSSSNTWAVYDASKALRKGDVILAQSEDGYDIYDYKYKKTNQTIRLEKDAKFFVKSNQLYAYSPNHLQISSLESMYGSFSFKTLPVKAIKKLFPDILLINITTFGDTSVQIDKPAGAKTYMLISTSGISYDDYKISGDVTMGELSNIFTVNSDENTQVNWTCDGDGESYHMYFITQEKHNEESSEENTNE